MRLLLLVVFIGAIETAAAEVIEFTCKAYQHTERVKVDTESMEVFVVAGGNRDIGLRTIAEDELINPKGDWISAWDELNYRFITINRATGAYHTTFFSFSMDGTRDARAANGTCVRKLF